MSAFDPVNVYLSIPRLLLKPLFARFGELGIDWDGALPGELPGAIRAAFERAEDRGLAHHAQALFREINDVASAPRMDLRIAEWLRDAERAAELRAGAAEGALHNAYAPSPALPRNRLALAAWLFLNEPELWTRADAAVKAARLPGARLQSFQLAAKTAMPAAAEERARLDAFQRELAGFFYSAYSYGRYFRVEALQPESGLFPFIGYFDPYPATGRQCSDDGAFSLEIDRTAGQFALGCAPERGRLELRSLFPARQRRMVAESFARLVLGTELAEEGAAYDLEKIVAPAGMRTLGEARLVDAARIARVEVALGPEGAQDSVAYTAASGGSALEKLQAAGIGPRVHDGPRGELLSVELELAVAGAATSSGKGLRRLRVAVARGRDAEVGSRDPRIRAFVAELLQPFRIQAPTAP